MSRKSNPNTGADQAPESTDAAPSLGAAILAPADPVVAADATADQQFLSDSEVLTAEASAAEPPVEDQAPRAPVAATDYAGNQSDRSVHPAALAPAGRFSNVARAEGHPVVIQFVTVDIKRDMSCSMRKDVPTYAVPILERIHEAVEVVPGSERGVRIDRFNPAEEFAMLKRRYDPKTKSIVSEVYPLGARQIAEITGVSMAGGEKFEQRQSAQTIRSREGQVLQNRS